MVARLIMEWGTKAYLANTNRKERFQPQKWIKKVLHTERGFKDHAVVLLPVTFRVMEQLSEPCWFEALQQYSPLSALVGLISSREETLKRLMILHLSPSLIGFPSLNHLKLTFGASSVSHSNLALFPTLTSRGTGLCLNTGFTAGKEKHSVHGSYGRVTLNWRDGEPRIWNMEGLYWRGWWLTGEIRKTEDGRLT